MSDTSITWLPVVRKARCDIYEGGARMLPEINTAIPMQKGRVGGERGKIEGLSLASLKRLKLALLTKYVPGKKKFGLTLTLPGREAMSGLNQLQIFKDALNHFGTLFRRRFPGGGIIYRVELQERKAPHLHCVCWVSSADPDPDDICMRPLAPLRSDYRFAAGRWLTTPSDAYDFTAYLTAPCPRQPALPINTAILRDADAVFRLWFEAVAARVAFGGWDVYYFLLNGGRATVFKDEGGTQSALRYLCNDISVHKQAQLGYEGKQWGIIGRGNFADEVPVVVRDADYWRLSRWLGKIRRRWTYRGGDGCRIKQGKHLPPQCLSCVGRCHRVDHARRCYAGVSYILPSTIERIKRALCSGD